MLGNQKAHIFMSVQLCITEVRTEPSMSIQNLLTRGAQARPIKFMYPQPRLLSMRVSFENENQIEGDTHDVSSFCRVGSGRGTARK